MRKCLHYYSSLIILVSVRFINPTCRDCLSQHCTAILTDNHIPVAKCLL